MIPEALIVKRAPMKQGKVVRKSRKLMKKLILRPGTDYELK